MKKNTKKERFFATALKLIHSQGFKATTMRDIANELNCEVGNVYNYVNSKQSLLEVYLFGIQDEFHAALDGALVAEKDVMGKLRLAISSYIHVTKNRPYEQSVLVKEWRNLKEPRVQEFIDRRKSYEDKFKSILETGMNEGSIRNLDLDMTTRSILAILRDLHSEFLDQNSETDADYIEGHLLDVIFNGIVKM